MVIHNVYFMWLYIFRAKNSDSHNYIDIYLNTIVLRNVRLMFLNEVLIQRYIIHQLV